MVRYGGWAVLGDLSSSRGGGGIEPRVKAQGGGLFPRYLRMSFAAEYTHFILLHKTCNDDRHSPSLGFRDDDVGTASLHFAVSWPPSRQSRQRRPVGDSAHQLRGRVLIDSLAVVTRPVLRPSVGRSAPARCGRTIALSKIADCRRHKLDAAFLSASPVSAIYMMPACSTVIAVSLFSSGLLPRSRSSVSSSFSFRSVSAVNGILECRFFKRSIVDWEGIMDSEQSGFRNSYFVLNGYVTGAFRSLNHERC